MTESPWTTLALCLGDWLMGSVPASRLDLRHLVAAGACLIRGAINRSAL